MINTEKMKNTWRHWINGKGYYAFKSFKVYWAYREYLTELYTTQFKPTGFEQYLIDNGFEQSGGKKKEFSTYDNCNRKYKDKHGNACTIGLLAKPTRIAVTHPLVLINGEFLDSYPTPDMFPEILKQVKISHSNTLNPTQPNQTDKI